MGMLDLFRGGQKNVSYTEKIHYFFNSVKKLLMDAADKNGKDVNKLRSVQLLQSKFNEIAQNPRVYLKNNRDVSFSVGQFVGVESGEKICRQINEVLGLIKQMHHAASFSMNKEPAVRALDDGLDKWYRLTGLSQHIVDKDVPQGLNGVAMSAVALDRIKKGGIAI